MKYLIDKDGLYAYVFQGGTTGFGQFITGPTELKKFFDENFYLGISDSGRFFKYGEREDMVYKPFTPKNAKSVLSKTFKECVEDAINNTGLYYRFGNEFYN